MTHLTSKLLRPLAALALLAALPAVAQTAAQTPPSTAAATPSNALTPEIVQVTVKESGPRGADVAMPVHVFKPTLSQANAGAGPWPVVIFSHGRATTVEERQNLRNPVLFGHVRYWHAKGYAVIAPIRPGYGENSAHDPETAGTRFPPSGNGPCTGLAEYGKVAEADTHAGASCQPDRLGAVMAQAGKTTPVPSLWLYAENDLYWGAEPPKQWHKAHVEAATAAGQKHPAEFFAAPPVEPDGHRLLTVGGRLWSPPLNAWLKKNGF